MDIARIRQLCSERKIEWTLHAAKRLLQRGISSLDVEMSLKNGVIIEDYPDDSPYPSCLIMGKTTTERILHIVCAIDSERLWIITTYEPNSIEWEADFQTRRDGA